MSSALQNRLVGTIIIVALAVIFLPDVLDGKKETSQAIFVDLPSPPQIQQVAEPAEFPLQEVKQKTMLKTKLVADVAVDDFDMNELEEPEEQIESESQPQTNITDVTAVVERNSQVSSDLSVGWVVQLGVFRHQKNVQELLSRLRKAGYKAFSRPVNTSSGELTTVFVGPELDKPNLESALADLEQLTKLKGRISPFSIK